MKVTEIKKRITQRAITPKEIIDIREKNELSKGKVREVHISQCTNWWQILPGF